MAKVTISFNEKQAGIELRIGQGIRLTDAEKAELKSLGFCWHRRDHYYYTRYSDEKYEQIRQSTLGKDATFPAKTKEKGIKAAAEARAIANPPKPKKTGSTQSARLDALEANMAKLIELMSAQATATTK